MMAATTAPSQPYPIPCRWCGETIAVRTQTGQLRVLGAFKVEHGARLNVTCPECQRMTRVTANLGVGQNRP